MLNYFLEDGSCYFYYYFIILHILFNEYFVVWWVARFTDGALPSHELKDPTVYISVINLASIHKILYYFFSFFFSNSFLTFILLHNIINFGL